MQKKAVGPTKLNLDLQAADQLAFSPCPEDVRKCPVLSAWKKRCCPGGRLDASTQPARDSISMMRWLTMRSRSCAG
jgi:hypothetical protein